MHNRAGVPASSPFSPGTAASRGARRLRTESPAPGAGLSSMSAAIAASPRAGVQTASHACASTLHHAYSMSYLDSLAADLQASHAAAPGVHGGHHSHVSPPTRAGSERVSSGLEALVASLEDENERLRCALAAERRARLRAEQVAAEAVSRLAELSQSQQQLVQQAMQREASRARVERWLHAASAHAHCDADPGASEAAVPTTTAATTGSATPAPPSAVAATAGDTSSAAWGAATAPRTSSRLRDTQSAAAAGGYLGASAACGGTAHFTASGWAAEPAGMTVAATVAASAASASASPAPLPHSEDGPVPEPPPPCSVLEELMYEMDELARRRGDSDAGGPAGPPHAHTHRHALGPPHPHAHVLQPHAHHSRLAQPGACGAAAAGQVGREHGRPGAAEEHELVQQPADCCAPPEPEQGAAPQLEQQPAMVGAAAASRAADEVADGAGYAPARPVAQDVHAVCHLWRRSENGLAAADAGGGAVAPCVADAYGPCTGYGHDVGAPIGEEVGGEVGGGGGFSSARAMLQRACTMSALPVGRQQYHAYAQGAPPVLVTTALHSHSSRQLPSDAAAAADWHGSPSVRVATPPAMVPRPRTMTMGGAEGPWATARMSSFAGHAAGAEAAGGAAVTGAGFASGGGASGSPHAFAASVPRPCSTHLAAAWQMQEPRLRPSDSGLLGNRASLSSALHAAAFGSSPHARTASQSGGGSPAHASGAFARQVLQHQHQQGNAWSSRRGSFAGATGGQALGASGGGAGAIGVGSFGAMSGGGGFVAGPAEVAAAGEGDGPAEWSSIPLQ